MYEKALVNGVGYKNVGIYAQLSFFAVDCLRNNRWLAIDLILG